MIGMPRAAQGPSDSKTRRASTFASSTRPTERKVRPQHSGRPAITGSAMCTRQPAASSTRIAARAFSGSNQRLKLSTKSSTSRSPLLAKARSTKWSRRQRGSGRRAEKPIALFSMPETRFERGAACAAHGA